MTGQLAAARRGRGRADGGPPAGRPGAAQELAAEVQAALPPQKVTSQWLLSRA